MLVSLNWLLTQNSFFREIGQLAAAFAAISGIFMAYPDLSACSTGNTRSDLLSD